MVVVANLGESIGKRIDAFVDLPKIAPANTLIVNRTTMTDFSQDLLPRMSFERIGIQYIVDVPGEIGPAGERVFKPVNDVHDQIRFYGAWTNTNTANGPYINDISGLGVSFWEITFYGTGLNILISNGAGTAATLILNIDGGADTSNQLPATLAPLLANRNMPTNTIVPLAHGLSLGMHTVRGRYTSANTPPINGFEVLNSAGTFPNNLQLTPGSVYQASRKLTKTSLTAVSFNGTFDATYGTPGTRGGHVVVYMKNDGTVGKSIQYTNTAQANYPSADHTNEEIIRTYHFREFGSGLNNDFSKLDSTAFANKFFTLDDGTTNLSGTASTDFAAGYDMVVTDSNANSGHLTINFVGTGLDLLGDFGGGAANVWTVTVNGASIGNLSRGASRGGILKIVSGLPYGTHIVKFASNTGTANLCSGFAIYGPKKPTLPSLAVELADYFVMADFVPNTTAGVLNIATGVLRKTVAREITFVNGTGGSSDWALNGSVTGFVNGLDAETNRQNAYWEYTFYGTGFEYRFTAANNRSANITATMALNAGTLVALTTANFPTMVSSVYGTGVAFAAGVLDQLDAVQTNGSGLRISGLPLGLYRVRFNNNTASSIIEFGCIDVITPIHSYKINSPTAIQTVLSVGSCGVGDSRNFSPLLAALPSASSQAKGFQADPSTASGSAVPMPDMIVNIKTAGNPIWIGFNATMRNSGTNTCRAAVYVDGYLVGTVLDTQSQIAGGKGAVGTGLIVPVSPGYHTVYATYSAPGGGTTSADGDERSLSVREI